MKKNMKMYSQEELTTMTEMAKKPVATSKLARKLAKEFNRTYAGVYARLLIIRKNVVMEPKAIVTPVAKTPVKTKSHTISSRPTKIDISDQGMTFYF